MSPKPKLYVYRGTVSSFKEAGDSRIIIGFKPEIKRMQGTFVTIAYYFVNEQSRKNHVEELGRKLGLHSDKGVRAEVLLDGPLSIGTNHYYGEGLLRFLE